MGTKYIIDLTVKSLMTGEASTKPVAFKEGRENINEWQLQKEASIIYTTQGNIFSLTALLGSFST